MDTRGVYDGAYERVLFGRSTSTAGRGDGVHARGQVPAPDAIGGRDSLAAWGGCEGYVAFQHQALARRLLLLHHRRGGIRSGAASAEAKGARVPLLIVELAAKRAYRSIAAGAERERLRGIVAAHARQKRPATVVAAQLRRRRAALFQSLHRRGAVKEALHRSDRARKPPLFLLLHVVPARHLLRPSHLQRRAERASVKREPPPVTERGALHRARALQQRGAHRLASRPHAAQHSRRRPHHRPERRIRKLQALRRQPGRQRNATQWAASVASVLEGVAGSHCTDALRMKAMRAL
mmetsp:Transcript_15314/g.50304  ORF Transcript_15314/g.50304 Transcript_15314/m.50304 type:complete len:294 (-) Transcript_15314:258-1139(-)